MYSLHRGEKNPFIYMGLWPIPAGWGGGGFLPFLQLWFLSAFSSRLGSTCDRLTVPLEVADPAAAEALHCWPSCSCSNLCRELSALFPRLGWTGAVLACTSLSLLPPPPPLAWMTQEELQRQYTCTCTWGILFCSIGQLQLTHPTTRLAIDQSSTVQLLWLLCKLGALFLVALGDERLLDPHTSAQSSRKRPAVNGTSRDNHGAIHRPFVPQLASGFEPVCKGECIQVPVVTRGALAGSAGTGLLLHRARLAVSLQNSEAIHRRLICINN